VAHNATLQACERHPYLTAPVYEALDSGSGVRKGMVIGVMIGVRHSLRTDVQANQVVMNRVCANQLMNSTTIARGVHDCRNDPVTYRVNVADLAATLLQRPQADAAVAICARPLH
jgi:hypothetical protein